MLSFIFIPWLYDAGVLTHHLWLLLLLLLACCPLSCKSGLLFSFALLQMQIASTTRLLLGRDTGDPPDKKHLLWKNVTISYSAQYVTSSSAQWSCDIKCLDIPGLVDTKATHVNRCSCQCIDLLPACILWANHKSNVRKTWGCCCCTAFSACALFHLINPSNKYAW